jgi:hypothetical protein
MTPAGDEGAPLKGEIFVKHKQITRTDDLRFRSGRTDKAHVKTLLNGLRIKGKLAPILLWKGHHDGQPTGELILLDGLHRLEAYTVYLRGKPKGDPERQRGIPATIVECSYADAMALAVFENTNDSIPLSPSERANAAWRIVRTFGTTFSKARLSKITTMGVATIARMRARSRVLSERGTPPTGSWQLDRLDGDNPDLAPPTLAEFEAEIEALMPHVKKAFGLLRKRNPERDAQVLRRVFGTFYFKRVVSAFLINADEGASEADTLPAQIETGIKGANTSVPPKDEFRAL